jgi:hypothetical protein
MSDRPTDQDWRVQQGFDKDAAAELVGAIRGVQGLGRPTLLVQPSDRDTWYVMRPMWPGDPSPKLADEDGLIPVIEGTDLQVAGFVAGVWWALAQQTTVRQSLN